MSRRRIGKVCVRGELVARTPVSVGGMGAGEHVDLDVAVDGSGRFYIPGTSLAGPMRASCRSYISFMATASFFSASERGTSWIITSSIDRPKGL